MNLRAKIAPSLLSADFARLEEEVKELEKAGADWFHLDVMDGHFVPNITFGPIVVEAVRRCTSLPLDVHLMVSKPDLYLEAFARAGSTFLSVHVETCPHLHRTVETIRKLGAKPGVVLNPSTPLVCLEHVLDEVDLVLLMTVDPGFGGQSFIPSMLSKISSLRKMLDERGARAELSVDGGVHLGNIREVAKAGATVFVAGSGILGTDDYASTIEQMRKEILIAQGPGGRDETERASTLG